mgnify:CR=1 FL=1
MAEKKGLDPIQKELLAQVADLHKMPEGAYSLRINGQLEGKNSSEHIQIVKKTEKTGLYHNENGSKESVDTLCTG